MDINIENNNLEVSLSQSSSGGTLDHAQLINRDANDQHPISAITGLIVSGDGTKFLTDDGQYKELPDYAKKEDLEKYATKDEIKGEIGEINSVLATLTEVNE